MPAIRRVRDKVEENIDELLDNMENIDELLDNMEEVRLKWRQLQLEQDDDVQLLQL
jgi:prefoldin subunit 5